MSSIGDTLKIISLEEENSRLKSMISMFENVISELYENIVLEEDYDEGVQDIKDLYNKIDSQY